MVLQARWPVLKILGGGVGARPEGELGGGREAAAVPEEGEVGDGGEGVAHEWNGANILFV